MPSSAMPISVVMTGGWRKLPKPPRKAFEHWCVFSGFNPVLLDPKVEANSEARSIIPYLDEVGFLPAMAPNEVAVLARSGQGNSAFLVVNREGKILHTVLCDNGYPKKQDPAACAEKFIPAKDEAFAYCTENSLTVTRVVMWGSQPHISKAAGDPVIRDKAPIEEVLNAPSLGECPSLLPWFGTGLTGEQLAGIKVAIIRNLLTGQRKVKPNFVDQFMQDNDCNFAVDMGTGKGTPYSMAEDGKVSVGSKHKLEYDRISGDTTVEQLRRLYQEMCATFATFYKRDIPVFPFDAASGGGGGGGGGGAPAAEPNDVTSTPSAPPAPPISGGGTASPAAPPLPAPE